MRLCRGWIASACIIGALITACASDHDAPRTAVPLPSSALSGARLIEADTVYGGADIASDDRRLSDMLCSGDLVTITTTKETVLAELPCDRFVTPDIVEQFRNMAVRVTVHPAAGGGKLLIEAQTRASIEFTIGHAWVTTGR
jgi:hypothetical protein